MKLIRKDLDRDGSGAVTLCPEEPEDMWHTYNVIQIGDQLRATAIRRVQSESATGSASSTKVRTNLTISVVKIDFDPGASTLHVNGTVCVENEHVKRGAYHTLDLELRRNFTLAKAEWDAVALERVRDACDAAGRAEVGAVVLQEGLAHICLLTEHMTVTRLRIEQAIPRKARASSTAHERGLQRFYESVYEGMKKYLFADDRLKAILVASPGFVAEGLLRFVEARAVTEERKDIVKAKSKMVRVHCSSGHLIALAEVLRSPEAVARLADTKYAREGQRLEQFYRQMDEDERRAWYGRDHVDRAVAAGAVGSLLISDALFRSQEIGTRKKYVAMVAQVRAAGGEVLVFSSMHESGSQLEQLGAIAALLTYPMEDEDEVTAG